MKLPRRNFLVRGRCCAAGGLTLRLGTSLSDAARAHHRPIRPRRHIRHHGASDRSMAHGEARPAPFVIENRPGAGGNIGTESVVRAPADGYALLLVGTANAISATLYEKLNFNFIRDIVPVAGIARVPEVMLVNPSLPATTVRELIAGGSASARPRTHRKLLTSSTRQLTLASPIPKSRPGSPTSEADRLSARPLTSASSSPTKPRSGARWSSSRTSSRSDPAISINVP